MIEFDFADLDREEERWMLDRRSQPFCHRLYQVQRSKAQVTVPRKDLVLEVQKILDRIHNQPCEEFLNETKYVKP